MSVVRSGASAPSAIRSAARLGVLGLAVLAAGCASKQASTYPGDRLAGPVPEHHRQAAWTPKVEIEDDGLPAQLAPRHRPPVSDDPSEPWSPNYGTQPRAKPETSPAKAAGAAPVMRGQVHGSDTAPGLNGRSPTRLSDLDEDAIIRRAIAEHEMRRRD